VVEPFGEFEAIYLNIPPENIVLLKAILESYDELGILRTIDKKRGDVAILSLPGVRRDLDNLLESLTSELRLSHLAPPLDLGADWFLTEADE
jgi:Domain of unknown function (DUF4911)